MSTDHPDYKIPYTDYEMPDLTIIEPADNPQPVLRIRGCLPLPPGSVLELNDPETGAFGDVVVTSLRYRPGQRCIILYVTAVEK